MIRLTSRGGDPYIHYVNPDRIVYTTRVKKAESGDYTRVLLAGADHSLSVRETSEDIRRMKAAWDMREALNYKFATCVNCSPAGDITYETLQFTPPKKDSAR